MKMKIHHCKFTQSQSQSHSEQKEKKNNNNNAIIHLSSTPPSLKSPYISVCRNSGYLEIWHGSTYSVNTVIEEDERNEGVSNEGVGKGELGKELVCTGSIYIGEGLESSVWGVYTEYLHQQQRHHKQRQSDSQTDSDSDSEAETEHVTPPNHTTTPTSTTTIRKHPRLFISTSSTITEISLKTLTPLSTIQTHSNSAIWTLKVSPSQKYLVLGCENMLEVYDIQGKAGFVQFIKGMNVLGRVTSLCFTNSGTSDDDEEEEILVTGGMGVIKVWSMNQGKCIGSIHVTPKKSTLPSLTTHTTTKTTIPRTKKEDEEEVYIWDLIPLPNALIASADSLGRVGVYNLKTLTLQQSFVNSHSGDCIALCTGGGTGMDGTGSVFYSGGIDGRVNMYRLRHMGGGLGGGEGGGLGGGRYELVLGRRVSGYDIRSILWVTPTPSTTTTNTPTPSTNNQLKRKLTPLTTNTTTKSNTNTEYSAGGMDILITGGIDSQLCIFQNPIMTFPVLTRPPKRILNYTGSSSGMLGGGGGGSTAVECRGEYLLSLVNGGVGVWHLPPTTTATTTKHSHSQNNHTHTGHSHSSQNSNSTPQYILQIKTLNHTTPLNCTWSESKEYLLICETTRISLYRLQWSTTTTSKIQKVENISDRLSGINAGIGAGVGVCRMGAFITLSNIEYLLLVNHRNEVLKINLSSFILESIIMPFIDSAITNLVTHTPSLPTTTTHTTYTTTHNTNDNYIVMGSMNQHLKVYTLSDMREYWDVPLLKSRVLSHFAIHEVMGQICLVVCYYPSSAATSTSSGSTTGTGLSGSLGDCVFLYSLEGKCILEIPHFSVSTSSVTTNATGTTNTAVNTSNSFKQMTKNLPIIGSFQPPSPTTPSTTNTIPNTTRNTKDGEGNILYLYTSKELLKLDFNKLTIQSSTGASMTGMTGGVGAGMSAGIGGIGFENILKMGVIQRQRPTCRRAKQGRGGAERLTKEETTKETTDTTTTTKDVKKNTKNNQSNNENLEIYCCELPFSRMMEYLPLPVWDKPFGV